MPLLDRRGFILSALAAPLAGCGAAVHAPKPLAGYRVRDPLAGYFDLGARRRFLRASSDPLLVDLRTRIARAPDCDAVLRIPVQDSRITLPTFYGDNAGWRTAVRPFWAIEDAVSDLAAANLVAPDRRHADCLVRLMLHWARRNALSEFHFSDDNKQAWYQIESTLFAFALALAAIRPDVQDRHRDLKTIDAWLERVARHHFAIPGQEGGTCCNNHFYRRALYATIIGVMVRDDALFGTGMRAITMALSEATPEGALPLEMKRGPRAAHYQNYALMYLAMMAQITERQGYAAWDRKIDGKSLHTLVKFNNQLLANPAAVTRFSGSREVILKFHKDPQYFAWFELYLSRYRSPAMEAWVAQRRPLYNRSLGGHLTAYFHRGA